MRRGGRPEDEAGRWRTRSGVSGGSDRERETHSFLLRLSISNGWQYFFLERFLAWYTSDIFLARYFWITIM